MATLSSSMDDSLERDSRGTGSPLTSCESPTVCWPNTGTSSRMRRLAQSQRVVCQCSALSSASEAPTDMLLKWPQTHEAEGAPVERFPYLQGMPPSLQSLFRGRQGRPYKASTAERIRLVCGLSRAARVSVWPCSAG